MALTMVESPDSTIISDMRRGSDNGREHLLVQRGDRVQPGSIVGVEHVADEAAVDDGPEDVDGVAAAEEAVHSPIVAVFVCCHRSLILQSYTALVRQPLVYLRARAPLCVR